MHTELDANPSYRADVEEALKSMRAWLQTGGESNSELRLAPSVVCRSDSLMLGLSVPRFAFRGYLENDRRNFINFRRSHLLEKLAPPKWADPKSHGPRFLSHDAIPEYIATPKAFISEQPLLADAVFSVPERFSEWTVITAELGMAHGEKPIPNAVPFARALELSGACAQSVMFMAASLLQDIATTVFGLAELSKHSGKTDDGYMSISALKGKQLDKIGREMGLRIPRQPIIPTGKASLADAIFDAIRRYIEAGIPVILPVDMRAFHDSGGYRDVHSEQDAFKKPKGFGGHAMLAVGVSQAEGSREILIMDPASYPFLSVDVSTLASSLLRTDRLTNLPELVQGFTNLPQILPVLPKEVRLSLGPELHADKIHRNEDMRISRGLFETSRELHFYGFRAQSDWPSHRSDFPGRFFLVRGDELKARISGDTGKNSKDLLKALNVHSNRSSYSLPWVWQQDIGDYSWFWNAGFQPTDGWHAADCYLGHLRKRPPSTKVKTAPKTMPPMPVTTLDASIITSTDGESLANALRSFPTYCKFADLYAFMAGDVIEILNRPNALNAVEAMASLAGNKLERKTVANRIHRIVQAIRPDLRFRAIASFIPEASSFIRPVRLRGIRALTFLARLAKDLNDLGHQIRAIEIVGGAKIDLIGLGPDKDSPSRTKLVAKMSEPKRILGDLAESIFSAVCATRSVNVPYALECEPGPLYAISGVDAMKDVLNHFDRLVESEEPENRENAEKLKSRLGCNLDLAHLGLLGKPTAAEFRQSPLLNRVFHTHISDFSRGHFADIALGDLHSTEQFAEWIALLNSLERPFSRTISMELEACSHPKENIERGFRELKALLGQL